jgi:hypothetical protein
MPLAIAHYAVETLSTEDIRGETCAESARKCATKLVFAAATSSPR